MGGTCSIYGEMRNAYKFWWINLKGLRGTRRRSWEDNIKVGLKETVCENVFFRHALFSYCQTALTFGMHVMCTVIGC